jgi:hypothetical protein
MKLAIACPIQGVMVSVYFGIATTIVLSVAEPGRSMSLNADRSINQ